MAVYYNMTDICKPASVQGFWYMDETVPGSVIDASANLRHGAVTGAITPNAGGKINYCLQMGDAHGQFNCVDFGVIPLNDDRIFSISTWINPTENTWSNDGLLFRQNNGAPGYDGYFVGWSWNTPAGKIMVGIGSDIFLDSVQTFNIGEWAHLVVVFNGTGNPIKVYKNGNGETITASQPAIVQPSASFMAGALDWNYSYYGYIDEPIYWDVALSDVDALDLYSGGAPQRSGGVSYVPRQSGSCGLHIF